MKTLYQSLLDYDMGLLRAIADCRDIPLETIDKAKVITQLCEALGSPATTAIALADLSQEERAGIQFIFEGGGQVETPRFSRQFGLIRPMGPARLIREQPWRTPVNPAERLWYKGFIFKAFQPTVHGNTEIIYLPTDLQPLLLAEGAFTVPAPAETPGFPNQARQAKIFQFPGVDKNQQANFEPVAVSPTTSKPGLTATQPPPVIVAGAGRLEETFFSLLVYLQTRPVNLSNGSLGSAHTKALADELPSPLLPHLPLAAELQFLIHLGRRAGLLTQNRDRLRPDPEPTRNWLQSRPDQRAQQLQNTWRADPTWNDLSRVPGLVLQTTGWENSPLLARSKILSFLAQETILAGEWISLDELVAWVKETDPDFQRPHGDYDRWYIYDQTGNPLMGFDHWDQVDGALIRYLIGHILFWLGLVDLGLAQEVTWPTAFRLTSPGIAFLTDQPEPEPPARKPVYIRVTPNFQAQVPSGANLYDRFQLARFAELETREAQRVIYRLSQASVGRALRNGVTADQMVAFLARATNNQTPLKVVETLRTWGARQGTAYLERATLLRLKDERYTAEISQNPAFKSLLGEVIGPTIILVPAENTIAVRRLLTELGYLSETE